MNSKKKALGKGLGALLEDAPSNNNPLQYENESAISSLDIDSIENNPFQPRKEFNEEALQELANSIKEQGIIQPITVRRINDVFQIISGERRLRAAKLIGLKEVPVYIREASDQEMLEMAIVENVQRENLNPIEIAESYNKLIVECGLTQEQLSEKVGKNRSTVTNFLRLLKLPSEIKQALQDEKISMGHARALISVDDHETQMNIFRDTIEEGFSVRDIEDIIRNLNNTDTIEQIAETEEKKKSIKPKIQESESYIRIKEELKSYLGAEVSLKSKNRGKGILQIHFNSAEELENILKKVKNT